MTVLSAFVLGLAYYAMAYILLVHLFVAWKWETTVLEEYVVLEYYNDPIPDPSELKEGMPLVDTLTLFLEETKTNAINKKQDDTTYSSRVDMVLANYHSALRNWDYWDSNSNSSSALLPEGGKRVKIISSIKLLMMSSLSDISADDIVFNATFQVALREFQGLADHKSEVQWDVIHGLLADSKLPDKEKLDKKDLYESLCKLPPLSTEEENLLAWDSQEEVANEQEIREEEDFDPSIYLSEDDLKMHYQMVEAILEKRNESIHGYLTMKSNTTISLALMEAVDILRHDLSDAQVYAQESIDAIKEKKRQTASEAGEERIDDPPAFGSQAMGEAVARLLESGLDALQRHKDVQRAIQEELKAIGVEEGIELEKVYTDFDASIPEIVPQATINVRRVIDTPLMRHSSQTIDAFLQFTRLYTDSVSKLVEGLNLPRIPKASTGKRLITYILQKSGMMTIYIPKQIYEVLLRKGGGRDFLSSYS
jgi:hypothetical protein